MERQLLRLVVCRSKSLKRTLAVLHINHARWTRNRQKSYTETVVQAWSLEGHSHFQNSIETALHSLWEACNYLHHGVHLMVKGRRQLWARPMKHVCKSWPGQWAPWSIRLDNSIIDALRCPKGLGVSKRMRSAKLRPTKFWMSFRRFLPTTLPTTYWRCRIRWGSLTDMLEHWKTYAKRCNSFKKRFTSARMNLSVSRWWKRDQFLQTHQVTLVDLVQQRQSWGDKLLRPPVQVQERQLSDSEKDRLRWKAIRSEMQVSPSDETKRERDS